MRFSGIWAGGAVRTNRAARVAQTAQMGTTLQNEEKWKFGKEIDKGTTRQQSELDFLELEDGGREGGQNGQEV